MYFQVLRVRIGLTCWNYLHVQRFGEHDYQSMVEIAICQQQPI